MPEDMKKKLLLFLSNLGYSSERFDDADYFYDVLIECNWFKELSENRKIAIIVMCFSLGLKNITTQDKILAALLRKEYEYAGHLLGLTDYANNKPEEARQVKQILVTDLILI